MEAQVVSMVLQMYNGGPDGAGTTTVSNHNHTDIL